MCQLSEVLTPTVKSALSDKVNCRVLFALGEILRMILKRVSLFTLNIIYIYFQQKPAIN